MHSLLTELVIIIVYNIREYYTVHEDYTCIDKGRACASCTED